MLSSSHYRHDIKPIFINTTKYIKNYYHSNLREEKTNFKKQGNKAVNLNTKTRYETFQWGLLKNSKKVTLLYI